MTKFWKRLSSWGIVVAILVLIFARSTATEESVNWINTVNYLGLLVAVVALFADAYAEYCDCKKACVLIGIFVLLLVPFVVGGVLIFTNIFKPTTKVNDIIMLVTLLISLPARFYVEILGYYMRK